MPTYEFEEDTNTPSTAAQPLLLSTQQQALPTGRHGSVHPIALEISVIINRDSGKPCVDPVEALGILQPCLLMTKLMLLTKPQLATGHWGDGARKSGNQHILNQLASHNQTQAVYTGRFETDPKSTGQPPQQILRITSEPGLATLPHVTRYSSGASMCLPGSSGLRQRKPSASFTGDFVQTARGAGSSLPQATWLTQNQLD